MKICLISFDFFDFDNYIVKELQRQQIDANHIDFSKFSYKYSSFFEKTSNFFLKLFLNKNIKKIKAEEFILKRLDELGHQDIVLVIRPDRISKNTHLKIKQHADKYIAYIYDSCKRIPIEHLLKGVFCKVFSFDSLDCEKYNFIFITNYIYLEKIEVSNDYNIENTAFVIMSIDERFDFLNKVANYFTTNKVDFKFIMVGKKVPKRSNSNIIFVKKPIHIKETIAELEKAKIFLDFIRKDQNGLSFRIFEAMAMQRKIITTNTSIKKYDFYNPTNILVLEDKNINIDAAFLETPYVPLEDSIYSRYTINHWVRTMFELEKNTNCN
jgi:hypothetical protein